MKQDKGKQCGCGMLAVREGKCLRCLEPGVRQQEGDFHGAPVPANAALGSRGGRGAASGPSQVAPVELAKATSPVFDSIAALVARWEGTRTELAAAVGVTERTVYRWEKGSVPHRLILEKLREVLDD